MSSRRFGTEIVTEVKKPAEGFFFSSLPPSSYGQRQNVSSEWERGGGTEQTAVAAGGTTWQDGRESVLAGRGWQGSGNEGSGGPGDVDAQLLRI